MCGLANTANEVVDGSYPGYNDDCAHVSRIPPTAVGGSFSSCLRERRVHRINPAAAQTPRARYSWRPKLPGTKGASFITIRSAATVAPQYAIVRPRREPPPAAPKRKARHVASHPVADARDPTSEIGTSTACPRKDASAVIEPTNITATVGVLKRLSTRPSR